MTPIQAEQFWKEWQAFRARWKCRAMYDVFGFASVMFADESMMRLEGENARTVDLKPGDLSCPAATHETDRIEMLRRTSVGEWGRR